MNLLMISPKHNGIGKYAHLLIQKLTYFGVHTEWIGTDRLSFDPKYVFEQAKFIASIISNKKYDVIHFQLGMYDVEQAVILFEESKNKAKKILTAHSIKGLLLNKLGLNKRNQELQAHLENYFDQYIFLSSYARIGFQTDEAKKNTLLFPTTLDLNNQENVAENELQTDNTYNIPRDYICLLGYRSPWKDSDFLLSVVEKLKIPANLVIAGPRWSDKFTNGRINNTNIFVIDKELNDKEIAFLIRNCLFGVFPYKEHISRQGNGVLPNFLALGKTCVCTDALCLPEYVGDAGLVVSQNTDQFANAIELLLVDSHYRENLGRSARIRSRIYHSWDNHISSHLRFYGQN